MNSNQLAKLMGLVRRTGDRAVIPDNTSNELFVIMDSDNYERLLNHTKSVRGLDESEMMDKINRDIALWRSQNDRSTLDWYEKKDDGFYHDNDPSFNHNYSSYDFDGRFGDRYWEKTNLELPELDDEFADLDTDDVEDPSLNEGLDLDDLERDGFVVEGEDIFSDKVNTDEPMYFEPTNDSILSENLDIPSIEIEDKSENKVNSNDKSDKLMSSRFEGNLNSSNKGKNIIEESLDDIEDDIPFLEEPIS